MDIRAQLEDRLTEYVKETLSYIETVRDFCDQEQEWTSERKAELEKMRDINENQQEEKLSAVLEDTLKGLEKLEPFLDAVEKLTVTSSHVFSGQIFLLWGKSPERVQSVITDARIDAPLLIHFRRDAETFFQPLIDNVNVLVFQLDNYVLQTEQLCRRVRQNFLNSSVLCGDIYKCNRTQPLVQLILNTSENAMNQMLDHLNQLCEIRMDQHTRLAFLFQEDAQKFIDVFSERRSRMWQFLSDLEETASKLDSMKKRASISTVAGSSVGILGGVLSILGLILTPFTAGASSVCAVAGAVGGAFSTVSTLVTETTEMGVNSHHESNAQSYLKSYKDDMTKIEECLKEVANSERPLVQPSAVDAMTVSHCSGEVLKETVNVVDVVKEHKSTKVGLTNVKLSELTMEDSELARNIPQVARLSKTGKILNFAKSTKILSGFINAVFICLDSYLIAKESISLAHGSKSEVSKLIRSRTVLFKSELEAWEKMHDSLCIGIKTISESQDTLEKPFLP